MTVEEFIQTLVLILCLVASCVVLPVGMVSGSMADPAPQDGVPPRPVIVFEDLIP